jgi:hypothetical protein
LYPLLSFCERRTDTAILHFGFLFPYNVNDFDFCTFDYDSLNLGVIRPIGIDCKLKFLSSEEEEKRDELLREIEALQQ